MNSHAPCLIAHFQSPLGNLTAASNGNALTGLWFDDQRYFGGAQAVGGAVGHNPILLLIPCHRVVGANGVLTGYAAGIARKRALLALEQGNQNWRACFA